MENREKVIEKVRVLSGLMVDYLRMSNLSCFHQEEKDAFYSDALKCYELIGTALKEKDE